MGACISSDDSAKAAFVTPNNAENDHVPTTNPTPIDRRPNRSLKEDEKQNKSASKLLLLGAGECGKSTILKQMKILHQNGFTKEERQNSIEIIRGNILQSNHSLIQACAHLQIELENTTNAEIANELMEMKEIFPSDNIVRMVQSLW